LSPNIEIVTKLRRKTNAYKIVFAKCEEKAHLGNVGVNGKIVLQFSLEK
jgi:ribosomal protein L7Ae-like RNA K-turn-binding protein